MRWRLKSPASRLFTQPFIQTQIKENIKVPLHWPLCGEFTGAGEFPAQMASNAENASVWWRHHEDYGVNKLSHPLKNGGVYYWSITIIQRLFTPPVKLVHEWVITSPHSTTDMITSPCPNLNSSLSSSNYNLLTPCKCLTESNPPPPKKKKKKKKNVLLNTFSWPLWPTEKELILCRWAIFISKVNIIALGTAHGLISLTFFTVTQMRWNLRFVLANQNITN